MTEVSDPLKGYRGPARERLEDLGLRVWADVVITTESGSVFKGIILPRSTSGDDHHVVMKLPTGYNIGIATESIAEGEERGYRQANYKIPEQEFPFDPEKPNVKLLGTGGTIASRLDYRTGAVIPAFSPGELYGAVPELADICNLKTEKLYGVFSENMGAEQYIATAKAINEEIEKGTQGVIIGHGTDTMHHTAAILSFMVQDSPIPIVLVGSQRSSDRPSSDAAFNLQCAAYAAAHGDIAETMVCMFGPTSDSFNLLHPGTRVRKMHSSYRSTFRTLGDIPLARVWCDKLIHIKDDYRRRRSDCKAKITPVFEEMVSIVYYYPNMRPDIIESLVDNGYRGIIIAGTGLGHVNKPLYPALKKAQDAGVHVYMTVQTLWGYVHMYVYETGRDMMALGVIPGENMLPETAYMKLCWVLAQEDDPEKVRQMMLTPINREITPGEPHNGYIILQGGIPNVDEFMSEVWK